MATAEAAGVPRGCRGGADLDAVAARAWAATVVVAPDVTSKVPFMGSSRRGSGVVVKVPDDGRMMVLTAAHVACLAGSRNRVRLRAPRAGAGVDDEWMTATVVGVHRELDIAVLGVLDDGGLEAREMPWLPLATSVPAPGEPVAALGYPMGWSGWLKGLGGGGGGKIWRRAEERGGGGANEDDALGDSAGRWGKLLAAHERPVSGDDARSDPSAGRATTRVTTHVLHTATVASGESGGPLISAAGEVLGVHSFGDAFYGGERDVAVAATADIVAEIEVVFINDSPSSVAPSEYATSEINRRVMESSDPALAAMCPELTPEQRRSWIL